MAPGNVAMNVKELTESEDAISRQQQEKKGTKNTSEHYGLNVSPSRQHVGRECMSAKGV